MKQAWGPKMCSCSLLKWGALAWPQQQQGIANGGRNGMVAHEEQQAPKRQRTANAALLVRSLSVAWTFRTG